MKNKAHPGEKVVPQPFAKPFKAKPYPVNAAKSTLPRFGIYRITFPNGHAVVYGSWQWKQDVTIHLTRAAEGKHKNKLFQRCYDHFGPGSAKVELLCCPLHFDHIPDLEKHFTEGHKALMNFRPHEFDVKLWLFMKRMANTEMYEGFVSDQPVPQEEF